MERYGLVNNLLLQLSRSEGASFGIASSPPASLDELRAAHDAAFLDAFVSGSLSPKHQKEIGFPWSTALVERTLRITGGTLEAARESLRAVSLDRAEAPPSEDEPERQGPQRWGAEGNQAGGTHHAFADRGEGFCIVNDAAVAARLALRGLLAPGPRRGPGEHDSDGPAEPPPAVVRRVLVVDLDVHQGNGTASMLADEPMALTLSVHAENNYPWRTRSPSDVDVGVPDDVGEDEYLDAVRGGLTALERAAMSALAAPLGSVAGAGPASDAPAPGSAGRDAARHGGAPLPPGAAGVIPPPSAAACPHETDLVLFQAGVDPLRQDRLGRLSLSRTAMHRRNQLVYDWAWERGLPVVAMMGGGYARPIEASVRAHADVFMQMGGLARRRRDEGRGWSRRLVPGDDGEMRREAALQAGPAASPWLGSELRRHARHTELGRASLLDREGSRS